MKASLDELVNNPNVRRALNLIANTEGTDKLHGYFTLVGGKRIDDLSRHPNIVGLQTKDGPSTAFGRYQITKSTYDDIAPKLGIKDMSPASQDKMAVYLMKRAGALDDVVAGRFGNAIDKLGGTWASLPSSKYNQSKKSWAEVGKILSNSYSEPSREYIEDIDDIRHLNDIINTNFRSNIYSALASLGAQYNLADNSKTPISIETPKGLAQNLSVPTSTKESNLTETLTKTNRPKHTSKIDNTNYDPENTPNMSLAEANPDLGLALQLASTYQQT